MLQRSKKRLYLTYVWRKGCCWSRRGYWHKVLHQSSLLLANSSNAMSIRTWKMYVRFKRKFGQYVQLFIQKLLHDNFVDQVIYLYILSPTMQIKNVTNDLKIRNAKISRRLPLEVDSMFSISKHLVEIRSNYTNEDKLVMVENCQKSHYPGANSLPTAATIFILVHY